LFNYQTVGITNSIVTTMTFTVTGLPPGATSSINSNNVSIQWTPTAAQTPGTYPVTISLTDCKGFATNLVVILEVVDLLAPTFTAPADVTQSCLGQLQRCAGCERGMHE